MVIDWQEVLRGRKTGSGRCGDYIGMLRRPRPGCDTAFSLACSGRAGRGETVLGNRARGSSKVAAWEKTQEYIIVAVVGMRIQRHRRLPERTGMRLPTTTTSLAKELERRLVKRPSGKATRTIRGRSLHRHHSGAGGEAHARNVAAAMSGGRGSERTSGGAEGDDDESVE